MNGETFLVENWNALRHGKGIRSSQGNCKNVRRENYCEKLRRVCVSVCATKDTHFLLLSCFYRGLKRCGPCDKLPLQGLYQSISWPQGFFVYLLYYPSRWWFTISQHSTVYTQCEKLKELLTFQIIEIIGLESTKAQCGRCPHMWTNFVQLH